MSKIEFVPGYLVDDYQLLTENIESYQDPEEPELFTNYVANLLAQLNKTPGFLAGMPDQLAMCLLFVVKIDSAKLAPLSSDSEPTWDDVKACVGINKSYRPLLSTLSEKYQHQLKIALLLLCFYELGSTAQEFNAEVDDSEEQEERDAYDDQDYEAYQGQDQDSLDQY
jgi:hypothetical protein